MGTLTDPWGIEDEFHDAFGRARLTSDETRAEVLSAMGVDPLVDVPPQDSDILVARPGDSLALTDEVGGELQLEDGTRLALRPAQPLPLDLPIGYHTLLQGSQAAGPGATQTRLLVTPGQCYLPDDLKLWGWAAQLYAVRSRASWGIGDLADLRALGAWTRALGGGALMVNPLCAPAPVHPIESSPYYPASRRFRNPLYLSIEELPGGDADPVIARLGGEARALNTARRIDRERIFDLKMQALEHLWRSFDGATAFEDYRREQGASLQEFAAYCALSERHGKDWRRWPEEYRRPSTEAVQRLCNDDRRVRFHTWVQWQLDVQLERASREVRVFHDLPVGFDIAGADGWCWQDFLASEISIGCPPDGFNLDGQDWGLSPFIPTKMRAALYRPFIETIRAMLRHAGGLRIDHVMGLFRLFWIPRRLGNKGGTYVRYPVDELLAIVAIESQRARAVIVGEDLGTVLPGTRELLAVQKLLSYRLLFFEDEAPEKFLELALSGVTTHDLATIAGIWTGAAADHARIAGVTPNEEGLTYLKNKLAKLTGLPLDAPVPEVVVAVHQALGRAPSRVLLATLDDALGVLEQPNMPGTTTSWPNWSLALPKTLEEIQDDPLPRQIAAALRR